MNPEADFELPKGTKSLNLYKLHPPFRRLVNGHGYPGVLLERATDGNIQCHVCGEWVNVLGCHIKAHEITIKEYKKKFSLRKKDHLVSVKTRQNYRRIHGERLTKMRGMILEKRGKNKQDHPAQTLASLNEKGLCPDQINYRFDIVATLLQKQPSAHDLENYDRPVYSKIKNEFGTFNKYVEYRGLKPRKPGGVDFQIRSQPRILDIDIIAAIRKIYFKKGRVQPHDFIGKPVYETVVRRFGSFKNALREAGIDPTTRTMIG